MSSNFNKLSEYIVQNSVADNWKDASNEWYLVSIREEEGGSCVCGQTITDHCMIKNRLNQNEVEVGNRCVNHFGGDLKTVCTSAHASLKRIRKDISAHATPALIDISNLPPKGAMMYLQNWRGRTLSYRQQSWIEDMNRQIIKQFTS